MKKPATPETAPAPEKLVKVTINRTIISKGAYSFTNGQIAEIPEALAKAWVDAKFGTYTDAK